MSYYWFNRQELLQKAKAKAKKKKKKKKKKTMVVKKRLLNIIKQIKMS